MNACTLYVAETNYVLLGPHVELLEKTFVAPIGTLITDFNQFCSLVENTIDLEQADAFHEYIIRPSFSAKLQELHDEKNATLEAFEDIRLQVAARLDLDSAKVKLDNNTTFGYQMILLLHPYHTILPYIWRVLSMT